MYLNRSSKERYRDFLYADYGHSFAEYLGIEVPRIEYDYYGKIHLMRFKSPKATGGWEKLKKDAYRSYKEALKNRSRGNSN